MKENTLYIKCKKTKDFPYGIKEVSADFALNKPTLISIVPIALQEKDLNGAIKAVGEAAGFISNPEDMVEMVDYYSWQDIEEMGYQFVSAKLSSPQEFYKKYFYPILFDKNGKFKDADALARDMRKINIAVYCASTNEIAKISEILEKDLIDSNKYTQKEIEHIMQQVCTIDVTSRKEVGSAKFTSIHLFSKADPDLEFPEYIDEQQPGIKILENNHEATIIVDQLNKEEDDDHTYKDFFNLKGDKTLHGQIMSVITNIIVSNMIQHSVGDKTLSGESMEELSFVFNDDMMSFFNKLLNEPEISEEDLKNAIFQIQLSRNLPSEYVSSKDKISRNYRYGNNLKKYDKLKKKIIEKLDCFGDYIILDEKFQESKGYEALTEVQKCIFGEVRQYCSYSIVVLKEYVKQLASLSFESESVEDVSKMAEFLSQLEEEVKEIDIQKLSKAKCVITAYYELERFKNGDEKTIRQWGKEESVKRYYEQAIEALEK